MAIGKLIITRFADLGHLGLYLLSYLIPRKKNVWVFGSWFGQNYSDNSKYFFEYVNQFTSIKAIWISQNREVVKSIQSKGYKAFHYKSMKAAYYISIAKVGVVSCAPHDIASYSLAKMKIINLWHGTALKKIMHDVKGYEKSGFVHELHRFLFPFKFISFSMISATSEETKAKFNSAFKIDPKKIKITGYPRNDAFSITNSSNPFMPRIKEWKLNQTILGIYLPTHRDTEKESFYQELIAHLTQIDERLSNSLIRIIVKLHFYFDDLIRHQQIKFENLTLINDRDIESDIYAILPQMDFLITDYSSVYFDFLLANKPIIFFPFDIHKYIRKDRELYYDYEEVTPGPKVKNAVELTNELLQISNGIDLYAENRTQVNKQFNQYQNPTNSSQKVYNEIAKLIGYNQK